MSKSNVEKIKPVMTEEKAIDTHFATIMRLTLLELRNHSPFLGVLATEMWIAGPSESVPTIAVSPKGVVVYNEKWMKSLSVGEMIGVLVHEALHVALDAWVRFAGKDMKIANWAHDFAINDIIKTTLPTLHLARKESASRSISITLPAGGLWDSKYSGWAGEEIYVDLDKMVKEKVKAYRHHIEQAMRQQAQAGGGDYDREERIKQKMNESMVKALKEVGAKKDEIRESFGLNKRTQERNEFEDLLRNNAGGSMSHGESEGDEVNNPLANQQQKGAGKGSWDNAGEQKDQNDSFGHKPQDDQAPSEPTEAQKKHQEAMDKMVEGFGESLGDYMEREYDRLSDLEDGKQPEKSAKDNVDDLRKDLDKHGDEYVDTVTKEGLEDEASKKDEPQKQEGDQSNDQSKPGDDADQSNEGQEGQEQGSDGQQPGEQGQQGSQPGQGDQSGSEPGQQSGQQPGQGQPSQGQQGSPSADAQGQPTPGQGGQPSGQGQPSSQGGQPSGASQDGSMPGQDAGQSQGQGDPSAQSGGQPSAQGEPSSEMGGQGSSGGQGEPQPGQGEGKGQGNDSAAGSQPSEPMTKQDAQGNVANQLEQLEQQMQKALRGEENNLGQEGKMGSGGAMADQGAWERAIQEIGEKIGAGQLQGDILLDDSEIAGNPFKDETPEKTEDRHRQTLASAVRTDKAQGGQGWGKLPAWAQTQIEGILNPPLTFDRHIKKEIGNYGAKSMTTFKKPNKRNSFAPNRPLLPGKKKNDSRIYILMDTSGSMFNQHDLDNLRMAYGLIKRLATSKGLEVMVVHCDADVTRVMDTREVMKEINAASFGLGGGGGSNFIPGFEYIWKEIRQNDPFYGAPVIVFTDGGITVPERVPHNVRSSTLWVTVQGEQPPTKDWGTHVVMDGPSR